MTTEQRVCAPPDDHERCVMCGFENPRSLGLRFTPDTDGGVTTRWQAQPHLQGYRGILHGGVVASLLDAAMTHCLSLHGVAGLTADLRVRYLAPVPCDARLDLAARLTASRPPLFRLEAELMLDGKLLARAEARFLRRRAAAAQRPRPG
ncbi:MAG: PaaI family thioesterase [Candidatus Krumholzibacteriia bacterium]